jgi:hypothetical protein
LQVHYYPLKLGHYLIYMKAPIVRLTRAPWIWVCAGGVGIADWLIICSLSINIK